MIPFVHLHLHTEYSLLDGATRIADVFSRCHDFHMKAVAITDHGNMYGAYQFYCKAEEYYNKNLYKISEKMRSEKADSLYQIEKDVKGKPTGNGEDYKHWQAVKLDDEEQAKARELAEEYHIKPIIGCEFYVVEDLRVKVGGVKREFNHLVILAKNNEGYKNLVKLNSIAFVDGFYYKPRIDFDTLKKYSGGLICLSACLAGQLPRLIMDNRMEDAKALAKSYKDLFQDDYYIELQDHSLPEDRYVNPRLIEIANQLNIELVATNDVHYLNRADSEMHDILLCVQTGKFVDDADRMRFTGTEFYLKNGDEMLELFENTPQALANTLIIADKCNIEIEKEKLLPNYVPPDNLTPAEYLRALIEKGLKEKYTETPEIRERIEYEYNTVVSMGFVEYYLIVWDFIHYAEEQGIPVGPGRGSGAGSIIAYLIGITKVEPLRYHLIFERFLNPERVSMPDFDVDFCAERRGEVIEYVKAKYGEGKVSQIVTFGTMAAKNAIKDVGRVLRVPYADTDRITKLIPGGKVSLKKLLGLEKNEKGEAEDAIPELVDLYKNDQQLRRVIDLAVQLEGSPRQTGMHAAGVVICRDRIEDHVPLQRNGEDITTQYNMIEVEKLGLLKMDFLGLRNLTDIKKAIDFVKRETGETIDFYKNNNYDDPKVYELISSGETMGIFQLESEGMRKLMSRLKPTCLEDIIAGISLFRPGPMQFIDVYVDGKHNPQNITYLHPLLEPILNVTYGCMVYQEQVMQIVRELGGFSYGQSDEIRRAMSKKHLNELEEQRQYFIYGKKDDKGNTLIEGCLSKGVSEEIANKIYDQMTDFASYAFNKSHAACYAYVSYQTAYLMRYHKVEFLTAMLNDRITNIDEIKKYIGYAMQSNIEILQPDINKSYADFNVEQGKIRFGLGGIKGIGVAAIDKLVAERGNGKFRSLRDFLERADSGVLNKRLVENLIKGGAFDCFNEPRAQMMANYAIQMDRVSDEKKKREQGQFSFFDSLGVDSNFDIGESVAVKEYDAMYKLSLEKEVLGMYVSGSPLEGYKDKFKEFTFTTAMLNTSPELDEDQKFSPTINLEGKRVSAGGILYNLNRITTRAGKQMASAVLEDLYGTMELVFFPKVYDTCKDKIKEDALVTIYGNLSLSDTFGHKDEEEESEPRAKITVDRVDVWESNLTQKVATTTLYIKMQERNDDSYAKASAILEHYTGDLSVILVLGKQKFSMPQKVRECNGILYELKDVFGDFNVKFLTKD